MNIALPMRSIISLLYVDYIADKKVSVDSDARTFTLLSKSLADFKSQRRQSKSKPTQFLTSCHNTFSEITRLRSSWNESSNRQYCWDTLYCREGPKLVSPVSSVMRKPGSRLTRGRTNNTCRPR